MAQKTPISILEELVVSKREAPPSYHFESIGNQINPEFRCTVSALSVTASETARSKKDAKQKVAATILDSIFKLNNNIKTSNPKHISSGTKVEYDIHCKTPTYYTEGLNYIGLLNEYASKKKCSMALSYVDSLLTANQFEVTCNFGTMNTVGYGRTKKNAKQVAACEMLNNLKQSKYVPPTCEIPKKIEFLDTSSLKAISKYKELSPQPVDITKNVQNTAPLNLNKKNYTFEEAENMLKKLNLKYEKETIQVDPYFVVVHADGPIHAMGIGDDERIATERAMNHTLRKISARSSDTW